MLQNGHRWGVKPVLVHTAACIHATILVRPDATKHVKDAKVHVRHYAPTAITDTKPFTYIFHPRKCH